MSTTTMLSLQLMVLFLTSLQASSSKSKSSHPQYTPFSMGGTGYAKVGGFGAVLSPGTVDNKKIIEVGIVVSKSSYCGGTILNHKYVLTAAHCIGRVCGESDTEKLKQLYPPADAFAVYVEGTCLNTKTTCPKEEEARPVKVVAVHVLKNYALECKSDDLAILELAESLTTAGGTLHVGDTPVSGKFHSSGYGYDPYEKEATAHSLKAVELTVKSCEGVHSLDGKTSAPFDGLCTVEIDKDVCQGDSGSGLKDFDDVVYGVVSYGAACDTLVEAQQIANETQLQAEEFSGGVFTAVNYHLDFICGIIGVGNAGCKPEHITKKEVFVTLTA